MKKGPLVGVPERMGWLQFMWMSVLAYFRLDQYAVCVMSSTKGVVDYHDYPDSVEGRPLHFTELTCKRCRKKFTI